MAEILYCSPPTSSPVVPLIGLSTFGGMRRTSHLTDDIADALVAIAVACLAAAVILWIFGLITPETPARELIAKVGLQAVPGSIGAMLVQNQLAAEVGSKLKVEQSHWGEAFVMVVGALFLAAVPVRARVASFSEPMTSAGPALHAATGGHQCSSAE